ncbi:MAG: hypothetical protein ACTTHG_02915 [Treponemataceae bacterium]
MNRVIGSIETKQISVLEGSHHIITTLSLKDGITGVQEGSVICLKGGELEVLSKTDSTSEPVAVALDEVEGVTSKTSINACIHGLVKAEKLVYSDKSPIALTSVDKLRKVGIYAVGNILG